MRTKKQGIARKGSARGCSEIILKTTFVSFDIE